jgi:hypothetical protein
MPMLTARTETILKRGKLGCWCHVQKYQWTQLRADGGAGSGSGGRGGLVADLFLKMIMLRRRVAGRVPARNIWWTGMEMWKE